jgi:hypothetical protein
MTPTDSLFVAGPVPPSDGDAIADRWRQQPEIGGTAWFFGQVRGDRTENGTVTAIEYTAYRPLADEELRTIVAETRERDGLIDLFVRHSLEVVPVGGIAMMIGVAGGTPAGGLCRPAPDRRRDQTARSDLRQGTHRRGRPPVEGEHVSRW